MAKLRRSPPQPATATAPDFGAAPGLPAAGAEFDEGTPDGPAEEPERGPMRRCVVTRDSGPKEAMLRFVLGPDRVLVPDLEGRLPGRGMWLSAEADVLERAMKRGAFARAARGTVQLLPDLRLRIEDGLRRRVRDFVGFARRGGQAICGREAVREWLQAGKAGLLVEASDGSAPERARLVGGSGVAVVAPLPAAMLGAVFGRDHVAHVAVAPGRLAMAIAIEAGRLAGIAGTGRTGAGRRPGG